MPDYLLWIDDVRNPPLQNRWIVARNYNEAIEIMEKKGCPSYVSFDHDLGDSDQKTGYDIVKWMIDKDLDMYGLFIQRPFVFLVHSQNPVGKIKIRGLMQNYLSNKANVDDGLMYYLTEN